MPFASLNPTLRSALAHRLGWTALRPAQPPILEAVAGGMHLLAIGPVGGGKLTAAVLGVLDGLLKTPGSAPAALVLTDDQQSKASITALCQACGLLAGGADRVASSHSGDAPPDVLILSPRGLEPLLARRSDWSSLRYVLIDSLAMLLPGARGAHLNVVLERLSQSCGSDPQRVAVSPSMGDAEVVLSWLCGDSQRPRQLLRVPGVGGRRLLEVERIGPGVDLAEVVAIKVRGRGALLHVDSSDTLQDLRPGLERRGLRCQGESRDCELVLSSEPAPSGFPQVISLAPPGSVRDLLRTVALTPREAKSLGRICLMTQTEEDFLAACAAVSLSEQRWVEPVVPLRRAWPVYLQQLVMAILQRQGVTMQQALHDDSASWALRDLGPDERRQVVEFLLVQEVLAQADGHLVLGPRGEEAFDRPQWRHTGKAFWQLDRFPVLTAQGQQLATIDAWFMQALPGFRFVLHDRLWTITEVQPTAGKAIATPTREHNGIDWLGPLRVYHPHLSAEIRRLLLSDEEPGFLKPRQLHALRRLREQWRYLLASPRPDRLLTFAGARVNGLVARLHHLRTGQRAVFNNLLVATPDGHSLDRTLERLQEGLSFEEERELTDLPSSNPFVELLPAPQRVSYLMEQLYDREAARQLATRSLAETAAPPVHEPPQQDGIQATEAPIGGDLFFHQLVHLARTEPTRNKWIFVPEPGLKWVLSERLLHAGVDWVNFRFLTPFQMALEVAAPHLVETGIHPKPEGLGPELLMKLLLQLPVADGYFRPLADQPGLAQPLWKAVTELRMAGLRSDDLCLEMFSTPAKGREFMALLKAYEAHLRDHQLGDRATVLATALQHIEEAPVVAGDLMLEYPAEPWSALERRFLDSLRGSVTLAWVAEKTSPRRWSLLCPRRQSRARTASRDCHLLAQLTAPQRTPARQDGSLRFFCAGRRDAEIQEVLRRIREGGLGLDQVEIAVHDPDSRALLWDKLQKHGLPATWQDGLPVSATTPGRAVLGLLQWSQANFACFFLRELLMAGLLQPGDSCAPATGARYLERAKATWGRETYTLHLGQLEARYRYQAQCKDLPPDDAQVLTQKADSVQSFSRWVERLLSHCGPAEDGQRPVLAALLDGLLAVLGQDVPLRAAEDRLAQASLGRALRDLRLLSEGSWTVPQCHRLIREKLESLTIAAGRPEPGKLMVTHPLKAGRAGRSHLFLLGLEAGSLLPDTAEDAILSDQERQRIHSSLELSTDRTAEHQFRLLQQLGSLDAEVTLSYACRDYRSGEQLLPSRLFFDAARLLHPTVDDYEQLAELLGEPVSLAPPTPEQAAGDAEWWLAKLAGVGQESESTVLAGFPWLWRGRQARLQRESLLFTAFDGWVPEAASLYDPRVTTRPISVSRLQQLAECPFRTFLKTALAVRPLELEPPDADHWLKPTDRGTALHETFAAYYRELRAAGSRPAPSDFERLVQLLELELARLRQVLPPPSPSVEAREIAQLHRDLAHFLKLEVAASPAVVACEVGFGMADTLGEPLARLEPVMIDLGADLRFPLQGRIDRIDRVEGGYEVIDYKTGYQLTAEANPRYAGGQLLQHALYALVAEALLDGPIQASSYYFPAHHAKNDRVSFSYPDKAELAEVLRLVMEPLRTGAFAHTVQSEKHCGYCDFRPACVAQSDQGMLAKYELAENAPLHCRAHLRRVR